MHAVHELRSYNTDFPVLSIESSSQGGILRAHWHTDVEMVFVLEDEVGIGINQEFRMLSAGSLAIVCSGDIHYYNSKHKKNRRCLLIFRPELIGFLAGWPQTLRFQSNFITPQYLEEIGIDPEVLTHIRDEMLQIVNEMDNQKKYHDQFVKSRLLNICATALRYFPTFSPDTNIQHHNLYNINRMQKVIDFLENNYMKPLTLDEVASKISLSQFHFSRLFKSCVGMNFKTFLNKIRIEKAEALIQEYADMPMIDIAYECGFESIRTFNRVFKSTKGICPNMLRNGKL